jgi:hypothetical protein
MISYQNRITKGNCERSFIDEYIFGKTECPEKQYPYKPSATGRRVRFSAVPEGWNPTPSPIPTQKRQTMTVIVATTPPAVKFHQLKDGHEGFIIVQNMRGMLAYILFSQKNVHEQHKL